ncbi:hypothetical protein E6W39_23285 [Kitasatospora acidiphila]|uniref:Uncharacterized protein n=1 Tax=Kitasatospora acidiphila TaxID=2567942 RepID=A0A540W6G8_9ACTN|nr:hypothetical protein [Kitasatospora acidiphila]TQF04616.1 hypothetical protein E6W39_23285 [Kitasatospora acidiphila]
MPQGVVPLTGRAASAADLPRPIRPWLALATSAAVLLACAAEPHIPGAQDYLSSKGVVPAWAPWAGGGAGVAAALAMAAASAPQSTRRRLTTCAGWAAGVLLLWTAVGIVFDVFRAFFWATGIPAGDFSKVDWPGFLTRTVALAATIALARCTLAFQRVTGDGCDRCGLRPGHRDRPTAWLGYTACMLAIVYPSVKYYWWAGGGIGRPGVYTEGFPVMETMLLVGGVVLSLALVRPWGRTFPIWVPFLADRRVPRLLPVAAGVGLSGALVLQGMIPAFAAVNHLLGGPKLPFDSGSANSWVILLVYGGWALFGLALAGATNAYRRQTQAACQVCGR